MRVMCLKLSVREIANFPFELGLLLSFKFNLHFMLTRWKFEVCGFVPWSLYFQSFE